MSDSVQMYAVIQTGGKQYRVQKGDLLQVECIDAQPGEEVSIDQVLLVSQGDGNIRLGHPTVAGCSVRAQYVTDVQGPKVSSIKYKKRKNEYRKFGHRQSYAQLRILDILG